MPTKPASKKPASKSAKKAPVKKSETTVRTVSASAKASKPSEVKAEVVSTEKSTSKIDSKVVNIVLAEILGTFILTLVAISAIQTQDLVGLFVGLTLAVVFMIIGAISGSHINPAVTFGLWTVRKVKTIMVPFYWGAQFIGAAGALLVANIVSNAKTGISFDHIGQFDPTLFGLELVGTAVFIFALVSVLNRKGLSDGAKGLGVGLALFVGLAVATSIGMQAKANAIASYQEAASKSTDEKSEPSIPRSLFSKGATLNPAIAFVQTEMTEGELKGSSSSADDKHYSRFALDAIVGTLVGAALGANLALLVNYRFRG